jgi:hypothetical protein
VPATTYPPFPRLADDGAYSWILKELELQPGSGEAIYAYDASTEEVVAQWFEARAGGDATTALREALEAGRRIVLHHNHPSDGSFISLDLRTLAGLNPLQPSLPGLAEMWAHGNNGPHYRIALSDPGNATAVTAADTTLTSLQSKLASAAGGHEVFASGFRHLVCLCLEKKGYVKYEYDLSGFPNYEDRTYYLSWSSKRLTMRDAFPIARDMIIASYGSEL